MTLEVRDTWRVARGAGLRVNPWAEPATRSRAYSPSMGLVAAATGGVRRQDVVVAGVVLVISLVQVALSPIHVLGAAGSSWFGILLAVVSVLPLAWRRVHPAGAAVVGSCLWWVPTDGFLVAGYVCAVLLFFSVGRRVETWSRGLLACAWGLGTGTVGFLAIEHAADRLLYLVLDLDIRQQLATVPVPGVEATVGMLGFWAVVLLPFAVGRLLAAQQRDAENRILLERESTRRQAVEDERARIVRELHDVVGHEVTLMSIQSEAAASALEYAPSRAAEPIAAVRETAHRANRELRSILDLLGQGEPTVSADGRGLLELTERACRMGIVNRLRTTGEPWSDAPQHWLAVNRIVQEGLTNAGKHAPGAPVDVALDWSGKGVRVTLTNAAPEPQDRDEGLGLAGMAERARLLNGTFSTTHAAGTFLVSAWLPAPELVRR